MKVHSPDFQEGQAIPKRFTCEGEDVSPEMVWEGAPDGAKSFALIVEDPDAPMGTFTHWVLYDIPAKEKGLKRGALPRDGVKTGLNDFGSAGYNGPCPPKGHGVHRYYFILMALDKESLGLADGAKKAAIERAVKDHILAEAKTMAVYRR